MINVDAYLVDWDRLVLEWKQQGESLELYSEEEDEDSWVEFYSPPEWPDHYSAWEEFGKRYATIRESLPGDLRQRMSAFLGSFGILLDDDELAHPVHDLDETVPQQVALCTLSPPTVDRLRAEFEWFDLNAFQTAAAAAFAAGPPGGESLSWFPEPGHLVAFIRALGELLATARQTGKGVVTWVG